MSKKYKNYIIILCILSTITCCFIFYSASQERKIQKQQEEIEKYVDDTIDADLNIQKKLKYIASNEFYSIGDREYIFEQIKYISDYWACLYSFSHSNKNYLNEYIQNNTKYNSYEEYFNALNEKYHYSDHENWNKTTDKLIKEAKKLY